MEGFDISAQAIASARKNAEKEGLAERTLYFTADANHLDHTQNENRYDLIVVSMALHHFDRLEECLDCLKVWLKPEGYLIVNEYIGPNRFQWTQAQIGVTNRLLSCLPSDLIRNLREPDKVKYMIERPTIEYMRDHLAFEAISSERIIPALYERFNVIEQKNYGGSILHLLFDAIMGNFDEENHWEHIAIIRLIMEVEKMFIDLNILQHNHSFLICQKPSVIPYEEVLDKKEEITQEIETNIEIPREENEALEKNEDPSLEIETEEENPPENEETHDQKEETFLKTETIEEIPDERKEPLEEEESDQTQPG